MQKIKEGENMNAEIAQSMEGFVSWWSCAGCLAFGFVAALRGLLSLRGNSRRRVSALIDFVWTSTSAASIAVALLSFGDLVWKAYEQQSEVAFLAGLDQLVQLNSTQLLALNCADGKSVPDAQLRLSDAITSSDSPCLVASRIAHWRQQIDGHTAEILQACPRSDEHYLTRNFSTSKHVTMVASCSSSDGATACMQARCRQERDVANILVDIVRFDDKLHADAALTHYREITSEALKVPLRDIHSSWHPFAPTPFFSFLPVWTMIFGARLARAAAELLDPVGAGKGVLRSVQSTWADIRRWRKFGQLKRARPARLRRRQTELNQSNAAGVP